MAKFVYFILPIKRLLNKMKTYQIGSPATDFFLILQEHLSLILVIGVVDNIHSYSCKIALRIFLLKLTPIIFLSAIYK
jgi:hypothetical protein